MGRPKKEDTKMVRSIRLSEEDLERIRVIQERYGNTFSEVLRKGVEMQYNLVKYS